MRTLHFIPSWYQEDGWSENEQFWYSRKMKTEFDDTVKQIQLFHRNSDEKYEITLLSYAPNLRHFLHRQGVYRAPYWSCFDAMCGIKLKRATVFSFRNLRWPEHIEFVYSPFVVIANLHGEKYAQVEFGEDGNLIQVDMYQHGEVVRKNIYDDRGFISSSRVYKNGKLYYQDYLDETGHWRLREYADSKKVFVNPKFRTYLIQSGDKEKEITYKKTEYPSMQRVIQEVFRHYLRQQDDHDIYCMAMHPLHFKLLESCLVGRKIILSFFRSRFHLDEYPEAESLINIASYIVTDSEDNTKKVQASTYLDLDNIIDITPFDTRVDFGISQQLKVQNILVPIEGLREDAYKQVVLQLAKHLEKNPYARVHLFTRQANYNIQSEILSNTKAVLKELHYPEGWAVQNDTRASFSIESGLEQEQKEIQRFFVDQCVDELEVSKCLKTQRVIVDPRRFPDLYLQISAISLGVPQIVMMKTPYVEHMANGIVLENIEQLTEGLNYYLGKLSNWNEAMVSAYELGQQFTTEKLVERWKEVMAAIE